MWQKIRGIEKKYIYILWCLLILAAGIGYGFSVRQARFYETVPLANAGMFPGSSHHSYEQYLTITQPEIAGFRVTFFGEEEETDDEVEVFFKKASGDLVASYHFAGEEIVKGEQVKEFLLSEPLTDTAGEVYVLQILVTNGKTDGHVSVGISQDKTDQLGELFVNELSKKDKEIVLQMTLLQRELSVKSIVLFAGALLLLLLVGFFVSKLPARPVCMVLMSLLGALYLVAVPMLEVPDEQGHYLRSYEISVGDFMTGKNKEGAGVSTLPDNVIPREMFDNEHIDYALVLQNMDKQLHPQWSVEYANTLQCLYAPVSYMPQAIGAFIGRLFTNQSVWIFYIARLVNLFAGLFLLFLAMKWMPIGKSLLILMGCMPIYMQQMMSMSGDAFINAVAALLLALIVKIIYSPEGANKKERILLFVLCILVALCKVVYLPLCFMVLIIPGEKLWEKKKASIYKIAVCLCSAICNLGWLCMGMGYLIEFRSGVNTPEQIKYVLTKPWMYVLVLGKSIATKCIAWLGTMVGAKMCGGSVQGPLLLIVLYLLLLCVCLFVCFEGEENILTKKQRVAGIFIFALLWLLTLSSLYVQWTPLHLDVVEGFQGRYFIPLLPLLMISLKGKKLAITGEDLWKFALPLILGIHFCTLFGIVTYYL